jgi:hypothetical protein
MAIDPPPFTQLSESPAPVCFVDFYWARLLGIEPRTIWFPLRRSTVELERVVAKRLTDKFFFNGQEVKISRWRRHKQRWLQLQSLRALKRLLENVDFGSFRRWIGKYAATTRINHAAYN